MPQQNNWNSFVESALARCKQNVRNFGTSESVQQAMKIYDNQESQQIRIVVQAYRQGK